MNWTKLIIGTAVLYFIYYLVIIVIDLTKSKKGKASTGYEVIDMDFEDEEAEQIETDFLEEPFEDIPKVVGTEIDSDNIQFGEMETQGLPVDDFVKQAREMSSNVEF